jgi:hypothetical protein
MVQNGGDSSNIDTCIAKASVGMDWLEYVLRFAGLHRRPYWFVLIHGHLGNVSCYYFVVLCDSFFLSAQFFALYIGKILLHKILNLFLDCWNSVVSIVSRLWAGQQRNYGLISGFTKRFFTSLSVHTASEAHLVSCSMGTGFNNLCCEANPLPTSTFAYAFVTCTATT